MLLRKEKRKYTRAKLGPALNFICRWRVLIGEPGNFNFQACAQNICEAGIKVVSGQEIRKGALLQLELFIAKDFPLKCKGAVIWCRNTTSNPSEPGIFEAGIQFTDIEPFDRKIIGNLTKNFLN